jgi:hypothetical protein
MGSGYQRAPKTSRFESVFRGLRINVNRSSRVAKLTLCETGSLAFASAKTTPHHYNAALFQAMAARRHSSHGERCGVDFLEDIVSVVWC